jgi:hypothetical protein
MRLRKQTEQLALRKKADVHHGVATTTNTYSSPSPGSLASES